jgi:hypothetical protein
MANSASVQRLGHAQQALAAFCFPPSPLLDRDHLHAEATALADVIFDRPKPMLLQKRVKPLAGKIVVARDLAPIGIDAIGVQPPPNHVVHVLHREKKHAIRTQQQVRGGEPRFRKRHVFEHIGQADDAVARVMIELFDGQAMRLVAELL